MAGAQHFIIKVDALCADAFFLHNLQPLTAATADVKRFGLRVLLPQRLQERAVDSQAALNFFYWRTEALFQCSIKGITHGAVYTPGSRQATPHRRIRGGPG